MKLWIVDESDYDGGCPIAAFTDAVAAEEFARTRNELLDREGSDRGDSVWEVEVDPPRDSWLRGAWVPGYPQD